MEDGVTNLFKTDKACQTKIISIIAKQNICSMANLLLALILLFSGCSVSEKKNIPVKDDSIINADKILIVYLSRTNNTKAIAEIIHKNIGGKLVAIELEKPYPGNYQTTVQQVSNENETGFLPPLKTRIDSIQNYDVVFVGFPTWGMKLPPPMKTFLTQYDLSGKTVIPFNTNGGYGIGSSFDTVNDLCRNSKVLKGFTMKGGVERDGVLFVMEGEKWREAETKVKQWMQEIKIIK